MKAVKLVFNCVRCGEAVELILTKRQLKAILKGFKAGNALEAERIAEREGVLKIAMQI